MTAPPWAPNAIVAVVLALVIYLAWHVGFPPPPAVMPLDQRIIGGPVAFPN